jgi:2-polyprenyl-6-methoxyphenol hydroxylase-like FAD-dependent oxidoreductase
VDLLVRADGLWSLLRAAIAPATTRYARHTAWREISPVSIRPGCLSESCEPGGRFALMDNGSRTYWFATADTPEGEAHDGGARSQLCRFACANSSGQ